MTHIKHFVLSRIGLGCYDREWFVRMVELFEAVTFSSIANQTCQDFDFLLVVDAGLQGPPRQQLERLMDTRPNFYIVDIDVARLDDIDLASNDWIYRPCRDYILRQGLISDPFEYTVTSLIDSDDAWNREYVEVVNGIMRSRYDAIVENETGRGTHVRHSGGVAVTFSHAEKWYVSSNLIEPMNGQFYSAAISVMARFSSGVSAYSCSRHIAWPYLCVALMFDAVNIETAHPMWLYVRHDRSTREWSADHLGPMAAAELAQLEDRFGIDSAKAAIWRSKYVSDTGSHSGWPPVQDQIDRIFRLTALNRQIELLENAIADEAGEPSPRHEARKLILDQQRAKRSQLLDTFYSAGETAYRTVPSLPPDHSSARKEQARSNLEANEAAWQEIVQSAARLQRQADAMRERGDLLGAIRGYGAAIESGPPNTALYYLRGTVRLEVGDKAGAIKDFEHGLRLDPNNDALKCMLAQAANE
jgi:hypothetical protein